jgi:hypothetical protein
MPFRFVALVLITSICTAQTPVIPSATPASSTGSMPQQNNSPASVGLSEGRITVPQGSLVALKLVSSIRSKSTHPGDPVRAVVAFPLAIETHVAIPAGTYVEGVIDKVKAHPAGGAAATVQLRFTRLLFANGYSVPLVATNSQAVAPIPGDPRRTRTELADGRDGVPWLGEAFAAPGQEPTPPPTLPSTGPSPGELAGIGIGVTVGILVVALVIGHHRSSSTDYVLFDSGWQFQMALQEPLTLDAAQVSAATAMAQ